MNQGPKFTHRLARLDDVDAVKRVMDAAIRQLLSDFLSPAAVSASLDIMGLDTQLIEDGTYYVVESDGALAGCGGWSRRATLFGGDHSPGRNVALLDPETDAARVRAMYTAPSFARCGVGRLILERCEQAAAAEGFSCVELAATLAGEPLYRVCGYEPIERLDVETSSGIRVPLIRMGKPIP